MKFKLLLSFILSAILITSCTKSKLPTAPPDTPEMAEARTAIETTNAALMGATWKVSSCVKKGLDVTDKTANYEFSFASNGTLTAKDGTTKLQGKWVTAYIDKQIRVSFFFQNAPLFNDVDGSWTITEKSGQAVYMLDAVYLKDALSFAKR